MTRIYEASVLLLTDNMKVGGVQRIVAQLASALSERGRKVGVAAEAGGDLWLKVPSNVARHHYPVGAGILKRVAWLRQLLRNSDYTIVHAHQRGAALAARIATVGTGVKVVEHVHNVFLPKSAPLISFRGHRLIACGLAIERMLIHDYKRPPSRISLVVNGVSDLLGTATLELPMAADHALPHIVAVGRLAEQKDPLRFVRVIHDLNKNGTQVRATWVGDGDLREAAEALRDELGVQELAFVGESDDIRQYLLEADLFVMTSRWEGLPLALLEAMSLGRAAIVPDVGSCADAVQENVNGRLYAADAAPPVIADLIRAALSSGTLQAWGRQSRARYEESFSVDRMTAGVERVYAEVLRPLH